MDDEHDVPRAHVTIVEPDQFLTALIVGHDLAIMAPCHESREGSRRQSPCNDSRARPIVEPDLVLTALNVEHDLVIIAQSEGA